MRPHIKLLAGDYLTYQKKYDQTNQGSPLCRLCYLEGETICHILAICPAYQNKREKILEDMRSLCSSSVDFRMQDILDENNPETLTQFILDPTSFNLKIRVQISDPLAQGLFKLSRDMCNFIHLERMKQLNEMSKRKT